MALSLIDKLFGKTDKTPKSVAKDRLHLVLMHDRTDISPAKMELIEQDIRASLARHLNISPDHAPHKTGARGRCRCARRQHPLAP